MPEGSPRGRALMVQGTGSYAGKSLLVAALCRIFRQDGLRVAPFKAQNMSLNAYVTRDGKEIARSQAVQALAAGVEPTADMNPVLLKPKSEKTSELVLLGRSRGELDWRRYREEARGEVLAAVEGALRRLMQAYDVVVLEGAGSPAEINLMDGDVANMTAADMADAPVLLVGDIDRGGVFAALLGTVEILPPHHRRRLAGFVLNKFRGDARLLQPAIEWLEARTGIPTLGVVPYLPSPGIDEEDSVALDSQASGSAPPGSGFPGEPECPVLDIAVIRLPRISNFTDFEPLRREAGVRLRYVAEPAAMGRPDAVILPGTRNTVEDLLTLYRLGFDRQIAGLAARGVPVVGICGGYQMLGCALHDPDQRESKISPPPGLGLLPIETTFAAEKQTVQGKVRWIAPAAVAPWAAVLPPESMDVYEIHTGRVRYLAGAHPAFLTGDGRLEGAVAEGGLVWGAQLHGLFDDPAFRRAWLNLLRRRRGLAPLAWQSVEGEQVGRQDQALNRLARHVRDHLDMAAVYRAIGYPEGRP